MTIWPDTNTLIKCVSVYVWLPTGSNKNTLRVNVSDDGYSVLFTVQAPGPFIDFKKMHRRWLKTSIRESDTHHPKYLSYMSLVSQSAIAGNSTQIAKATIGLRFQCNPEAQVWPLGWSDEKVLVANVDLSMAGARSAVASQLDNFSKDKSHQ